MTPSVPRLLPAAVVALLAGVASCSSAPMTPRPPQTAETFDHDVVQRVRLRYLLALPEGYDDRARAGEKWPLVVFLHGVGECGEDLELVKRHGPPKLIERGEKLPAIVVSPQSPIPWWPPFAVNALIDDLCARLRVDPSRLYLTGLSLGGFGTWAAAIDRPDRFAAIVPICGGGDWVGVRRLKDLPIWVFHGRLDEAVPLAMSEQMVRSLERAGGHPKFTIYDDLAHDSWTRAYDDPELWTWLFSQRRSK